MKFYTKRHRHSCGIDLHARSLSLCVLDEEGEVMLEKTVPARPKLFLDAVRPFRDDLVVGAECMFSWYWLADLCSQEEIPFVLGHALYMKAIHGAKTKNDRVDALKIASLLRGGLLPQAYVYPRQMRATRDLMRRRLYLVRTRGHLLAHILNTNSQYNLPPISRKLAYRSNRDGIGERFPDDSVRKSVAVDLELIDHLDRLIADLELFIIRKAKVHDPDSFHRLRSVPGIGKILSLTLLYEIHDIRRFPRVQEFASYSRLVRCPHESAGKKKGSGGRKIGNPHLKWAFSEAAVLFLRANPPGQRLLSRLQKKHGKGKALSILAHKIGRAAYYILTRKTLFDTERFLQS